MHGILAQLQIASQSVNRTISTQQYTITRSELLEIKYLETEKKTYFGERLEIFPPKLQNAINNLYSIDHLLQTVWWLFSFLFCLVILHSKNFLTKFFKETIRGDKFWPNYFKSKFESLVPNYKVVSNFRYTYECVFMTATHNEMPALLRFKANILIIMQTYA